MRLSIKKRPCSTWFLIDREISQKWRFLAVFFDFCISMNINARDLIPSRKYRRDDLISKIDDPPRGFRYFGRYDQNELFFRYKLKLLHFIHNFLILKHFSFFLNEFGLIRWFYINSSKLELIWTQNKKVMTI